MEATPGNPPPKRTRAKATSTSSATKPASKPAASRKKSATEPASSAKDAAPEIVSKSLTTTDLKSMIETAAFYRAAARNFEPGHELEDWLEAERQIRARYA